MTTLSVRRPSAAPWLGLAGLLLLAYLVYRPGLSGGFLFDDFVNLNALGATGRVDDWPAFWRYITSGTADPTGRPLSLLSFLIDARAWPADPAPFLRTNVLLHLLNGGLLFVLLRMLGARLRPLPRHVDAAALLGAALWLLHPIFVSTTLYVVQREAMLPATFILLGLIAWVRGTGLLDASPRAGVAWMCFAILVCTPLAVLSKANGMLLPLLAWAIDATLLRDNASPQADRTHRLWRRALIIAPSILVFLYVASQALHPFEPVAGRSWTIAERFMTQGRVLIDYIFSLIVPRTLTTGLYNDAYVVSRDLLHPRSTLPALVAIASLLGLAFAQRRRFRALSAALLFFFASHLLESTVIPLELYFEHRNYLPAMLLGWPLALWICDLRIDARARIAIASILLGVLCLITWQRTTLWAQQDRMAWLWAARSPESPRAQSTAAIFETKAGRPDLAIARLEERARANPDDLQYALNLANAKCAQGALSADDIAAIGSALRTAVTGDQLVHRWLAQALELARTNRCRGLTITTVEAWIADARQNPRLQELPGRIQDLDSIEARIALLNGDPAAALALFDRALVVSPTPQVAAGQAAMLATAHCYDEALRHLDHYATLPAPPSDDSLSMRRMHAWVVDRQDFWPQQMAGLRAEIASDLRRNGNMKCAK